MDKYTLVNGNYLRVWLTASLINGIVCSILLSSWGNFFSILALTVGCSLLFSVPILLVAMIVTSLILSAKKNIGIFETVLWVTTFVSLAGTLCFAWLFHVISEAAIPLGISIVASAVVAVIIFQNKLKIIDVVEE